MENEIVITRTAITEMDYLMSLVGKDQETITEAIKELAENCEKVKTLEKENSDMHSELKEANDEIHYLKNKLNQKYDMLDDLEHELDKSEEKLKDSNKQTESKEYEVKVLENLINEQVDEINVLRENNQSMVSQIAENIQMLKKLNIQKRIIEELQKKLDDDIIAEENKQVIDERDRLLKEIVDIEKENKEKMELLKNIEKEKATLEEKLEKVETENSELKDCATENQKSIPLSEELSLAKEFIIKFECGTCEKRFETKSELKRNIRKIHELAECKLKLLHKDKEVIELKYGISSGLLKLKEKEAKAKFVCQCKGVCKIKHKIYNWIKPVSETLANKSIDILEKKADVEEELEPTLLQCPKCDTIFETSRELKTHTETLQCIETCLVNPWGLNFMQ